MRDLTLRRATLRDLDRLVALEREFPSDRMSRRSFRRLLGVTSAEVWACLDRGRVIGNAVLLFRRGARVARLYSLVVAADARGRGIGAMLLAAGETAARRRHCERLALEVRVDNRAALKLYEERRYRIVRRVARYYDDGAHALRLERKIVNPRERRDVHRLAA